MALRHTDGHVDKGISLARGPALVIGSILTAFGLILMLKNGDTPTGGFPDGDANGTNFLGFETNGWTAFFTITAGALLLFGAAQHLLAKTMSLLVGLALAACVVLAIIDGDDVLGLAATNFWTKLGWAIAAAALLVNALLPRAGRKEHRRDDELREPVVAPRPARRAPVATQPVETHAVEAHPARVTHGEELPGTREGVVEDRTRIDDGAGQSRTGRFDRDRISEDRLRDDGSVADDQLRR